MDQRYLLKPIPNDKYDLLTREDLITLNKGQEDLIKQIIQRNSELESKLLQDEQKSFLLEEQTINIKHKLFGRSSEKSDKKDKTKKSRNPSRKRILLASERYPNLDIIEKTVELNELPSCPCCSSQMSDSGLTEDSEYLSFLKGIT